MSIKPPPIGETPSEYDDRALLLELEPEAGRLFDRHAKVAQEWFPHDYIPYRLGRDFDKEPWTPDQPRLTGVAQTAFEVGLLTEDNLPSYHRLIHGMFGQGDGAWINWVGRWTAEEARRTLAEHLEKLDLAAKRFEAKVAQAAGQRTPAVR